MAGFLEEAGRRDEVARNGGERADLVDLELLLEPGAPSFLVS